MKLGSFQFSFPSEGLSECLDRFPSDKVAVVSVIGKSADISGGSKATALHGLLSKAVFGAEAGDEDDPQVRVQGFYCASERVVYLHLKSPLDVAELCRLCRQMRQSVAQTGYLTVWSQLRYAAARALLLLFSVSHLVILHQPGHVLDLSYIGLLSAVDACRQSLQPAMAEVLGSIPGIPPHWLSHGRPCPPRLLFYFASCPSSLRRLRGGSARDPVQQLQHSLEDQIYRLLRKVRLITNASMQSLFALPGNQPFVHVECGGNHQGDPLLAQVQLLQRLCLAPDDRSGTAAILLPPVDGSEVAQSNSFAALVNRHLNTARTKGFDDNVAKHLTPPNFELPPANVWYQVCEKLFQEIVVNHEVSAFEKPLSRLSSTLDCDARFSEARCAKVLPLAVAAYQEGLPARYSLQYHKDRIEHAEAVFKRHARGPASPQYTGRLRAECEALWRQGRQICESPSLTGNPCINPVHRLPGQSPDADGDRPEMDHCSGVRYLATCDCGRKQRQRDDPFLVKRANYDFYLSVAEGCCRTLQRHHFPVFRPGAGAARPATVSIGGAGGRESVTETPPAPTDAGDTSISPEYELELSQGAAEDAVKSSAAEPSSSPSDISLPVGPQSHEDPETLASTEEYLDGMLTSTTPKHLLPKYSSFSLVCVGQSSLYSHAAGLNGFIHGANYLLPWELRMKSEKQESFKRFMKKKDIYDIYAKIFVGMEYECPRGHRFIMSAPDRIMKAPPSTIVKDSASVVANNDMPLFFNCPCSKKTKPFVGQLMRVHVVTPKSSVRVTVEARVQAESPDGLIFIPGGGAVELSPAAYWVLRLPHLYQQQGERVVAPPREEVPPAGSGRLLSHMFAVVIRDEVV